MPFVNPNVITDLGKDYQCIHITGFKATEQQDAHSLQASLYILLINCTNYKGYMSLCW